MRFKPYYTVSYRGKFYRAGVEFDIAESDAEIMNQHGCIVAGNPPEKEEPTQAVQPTANTEKPVKKAGRPRKQA